MRSPMSAKSPRAGRRFSEGIIECVVGDHRSDLSAPERSTSRCRTVLRYDRQARPTSSSTFWPTPTRSPRFGDRSEQINDLLLNAQHCSRGQRTRPCDREPARDVSAVSTQFQGLVKDNPNLTRVLSSCAGERPARQAQERPRDVLSTLNKFTAVAGRSAGIGPYFQGDAGHLVLTRFCSRGSCAFRSAGSIPRNSGVTPACLRPVPDPNGQRFPNGAPPSAPTPLEGTPEHPGPAVRRARVLLHPAADGLPTAATHCRARTWTPDRSATHRLETTTGHGLARLPPNRTRRHRLRACRAAPSR